MTDNVRQRNPLPLAVSAALINVENRIKGPILRIAKFGHNPSIGTTSEVLDLQGGPWPSVQVGDQLRVQAGGNAADDAAGAGAQVIEILGINSETLLLDSDTIDTAGASASSPTTKSFIRQYRAKPIEVGTYQATNTGNIVIEDDAGNNDLLQITAGFGSTQFGAFSTPVNFAALMANVTFFVNSIQAVTLMAFLAERFDDIATPFSAKRIIDSWDGVAGAFHLENSVFYVPPLSDFWFEGAADAATGSASVNWDVYLVPVRTN